MDRTEKMVLDLCKKLDRTKPIVALCVLKGGYEERAIVFIYLESTYRE